MDFEDWNKHILDSNFIILNLDEMYPDEFEFIIKILKHSDLKEFKTLIVISTIMTWSKTSFKNTN